MEQYRFERLTKADLHHLVYLYKECFNINTDIEFLSKKYNTTFFGPSFIGFIAFKTDTNEVAGYYGVFPIVCQLNSEKIIAAQSGDTMTHPKHQGKGLFTQLAKATYELAEKEGLSFIFGFPNKNSYPGFVKKLAWKFNNNINIYIIKTGALPFDKLAKKFTPFSRLYNWYVKKRLRCIEVADYFENSLKMQHPDRGYIVHDANFFNYKKYYCFYKIKINNTLCIIKIDGRMWIGDIAYCTKAQYQQTLNKLLILAKKLGCSSVHISLTNNTFYDKIMQEQYREAATIPIGYLNLNGYTNGEKFEYQAIDFDTY